MRDEERIDQLLEELLDSQKTPEEICGGDSFLLSEVRRRLEHLRRIERDFEVLFPSSKAARFQDADSSDSQSVQPYLVGHEIEGVLGRGGMGVVYKAHHLALNRSVAVKMLLAGTYASPHELVRFRREAEAVARLRHPNIVQIYDAGATNGQPFFTMELIDGGRLAPQINGRGRSVREAAELVAILANAVHFAHRNGIVHRDLKPANILFMLDGTPKITDFGLAFPIDGSDRLTLTGARVGTTCYMAPEQTLGKVKAIGPATDIWALGVILYELLAGSPPFVGESPVETDRQIISDDPVPPSRRNAKVPRDLETICLKCLQKNPARRYPSAQDLADDLHRFLDHKPVTARPVGIAERSFKWARRRPAVATAIGSLSLLLIAVLAAGAWLLNVESKGQIQQAQRRGEAQQAIVTSLIRVYDSAQLERWSEASGLLDDCRVHLTSAASEGLVSRVEQADFDLKFARKLDEIRLSTALATIQHFRNSKQANQTLANEFSNAFNRAGFDLDDDLLSVERIRTSPLRNQLLVAIDEWAFAAFQLDREELNAKLLRIARRADQDFGWRCRFRDAENWRSKVSLVSLAEEANALSQLPDAHQLAIIIELLKKLEPTRNDIQLLQDALQHRPDNYWLNLELAHALGADRQPSESAVYFRIAIALRPESLWARNHLANQLFQSGKIDESLSEMRRAIVFDRSNSILRHNFVTQLILAKRFEEALHVAKRAFQANQNDPWAVFDLADSLQAIGNHSEEVIALYRKFLDFAPAEFGVGPIRAANHTNLGVELLKVGAVAEAADQYQKTIELEPESVIGHITLGVCWQKLGRYDAATGEFQWVIQKKLGLKAKQADLNLAVDREHIEARYRLVDCLMGLERFVDAVSAAEAMLTDAENEFLFERLETMRSLRIARLLSQLQSKIDDVIASGRLPTDADTQQAMAEWLLTRKKLTAKACELYEMAFAKRPSLAEDFEAQHRFNAACAAAQAGCGIGTDATVLDEAQRTKHRNKALDWLRAELEACNHQHESAGPEVEQMLHAWRTAEALGCVRESNRLEKLADPERAAWEAFWSDAAKIELLAVKMTIAQARKCIEQMQWDQAAKIFAFLARSQQPMGNEEWFEFAAVQLLSRDLDGYRETCELILERARGPEKFRPYLAARACTLGPGALESLDLIFRLSEQELKTFKNAFWSLTEQGALNCRLKRSQEAIPLFEKSIDSNPKAGAAILNWLWLSLAYHDICDSEQERLWRNKAIEWLDALGSEMPANASDLNLHRHNWLEAQVLRQEAESIAQP